MFWFPPFFRCSNSNSDATRLNERNPSQRKRAGKILKKMTSSLAAPAPIMYEEEEEEDDESVSSESLSPPVEEEEKKPKPKPKQQLGAHRQPQKITTQQQGGAEFGLQRSVEYEVRPPRSSGGAGTTEGSSSSSGDEEDEYSSGSLSPVSSEGSPGVAGDPTQGGSANGFGVRPKLFREAAPAAVLPAPPPTTATTAMMMSEDAGVGAFAEQGFIPPKHERMEGLLSAHRGGGSAKQQQQQQQQQQQPPVAATHPAHSKLAMASTVIDTPDEDTSGTSGEDDERQTAAAAPAMSPAKPEFPAFRPPPMPSKSPDSTLSVNPPSATTTAPPASAIQDKLR
jgi:hypothetical protein